MTNNNLLALLKYHPSCVDDTTPKTLSESQKTTLQSSKNKSTLLQPIDKPNDARNTFYSH